jgi:hypothetical protein
LFETVTLILFTRRAAHVASVFESRGEMGSPPPPKNGLDGSRGNEDLSIDDTGKNGAISLKPARVLGVRLAAHS